MFGIRNIADFRQQLFRRAATETNEIRQFCRKIKYLTRILTPSVTLNQGQKGMSLVVSHLSVNLYCSYEHAMRASCNWTLLGRLLLWIYGVISYGPAINYTKLFENYLQQGIFWRIILSLSSWKIVGSHKKHKWNDVLYISFVTVFQILYLCSDDGRLRLKHVGNG